MLSSLALIVLASFSETGPSLAPLTVPEDFKEEVQALSTQVSDFGAAMRRIIPTASNFYPLGLRSAYFLSDPNGGERFAYVDFKGTEGCAVLSPNWEMPCFIPNGHIDPALFQKGTVYFDRERGFLQETPPEADAGSTNPRLFQQSGTYGGQESGAEGCGKIIDPTAYVASRYGTGWIPTSAFTPDWSSFHAQSEFSIYKRRLSSGQYEYENNCLLASLYEAFDYYRSIGVCSAYPSDVVASNPEADLFYSGFMSETTNDGHPLYAVYHNSEPRLYKVIRDYFRDHDSYSFGPATISKSINLVTYLNGRYGSTFSCQQLTSWNYDNDIKASIPEAMSLYIWNETYGTYPEHSMPVCGTAQFSKTTGWWLFSHTDYVNLIRVNDNLVNQARYIDLTAYQNEYPNSGSFIKISRNS